MWDELKWAASHLLFALLIGTTVAVIFMMSTTPVEVAEWLCRDRAVCVVEPTND